MFACVLKAIRAAVSGRKRVVLLANEVGLPSNPEPAPEARNVVMVLDRRVPALTARDGDIREYQTWHKDAQPFQSPVSN